MTVTMASYLILPPYSHQTVLLKLGIQTMPLSCLRSISDSCWGYMDCGEDCMDRDIGSTPELNREELNGIIVMSARQTGKWCQMPHICQSLCRTKFRLLSKVLRTLLDQELAYFSSCSLPIYSLQPLVPQKCTSGCHNLSLKDVVPLFLRKALFVL